MASPTSASATPSPKQLVFLFMAATVVAVVVFLCGVLVGRGVPLRQTADGRSVGPVGGGAAAAPLQPAVLDPVSGEPSAAAGEADDLSYPRSLEESGPAEEPLRSAVTPEVAPPEAPPPPAPEPPAPAPPEPPAFPDLARQTAPAASPPSAPTPAGYAYTVQVAALRAHDAAERVAGQLIAKGFPAYVVEPAPDAPVAVYRVRVGQYRNHGEAEQIRDRLETEEQFKPWITR